MRTQEPTKELPHETTIWRYMDLPRFAAVLASRALWFAKLACFEDRFEGFCTVAHSEMPQNDPLAKVVTSTKDGKTSLISMTQVAVDFSKRAAAYFDNAPDHIYVNSWCLADESMAMWEIYGSKGRGIALRSSIGQYRRAAKLLDVREEQYALDKVTYDLNSETAGMIEFDFREGSIPVGSGLWPKLLRTAFRKRNCFDHEREWRAALFQEQRDISGCNIDFDLDELISAVVVGPRAEGFLFDIVGSVMEKYGLNKPVQKSALLTAPLKTTKSG